MTTTTAPERSIPVTPFRWSCPLLVVLLLGGGLTSCSPPVPSVPNGVSGNGTGQTSDHAAGTWSNTNSASPFRFKDRAPSAGVEFIYQNGSEANRAAILESLGGGCGVLDFDRDQDLDVFFPGGGKYSGKAELQGLPSALFRNETGWQFRPVTAGARVGASRR